MNYIEYNDGHPPNWPHIRLDVVLYNTVIVSHLKETQTAKLWRLTLLNSPSGNSVLSLMGVGGFHIIKVADLLRKSCLLILCISVLDACSGPVTWKVLKPEADGQLAFL